MTKAELRKLYFEKRLALTDRETIELSEELCQTFFLSVDLSGIRVLHTFLPIKKNKEPDTFYIINRIEKEYPGIQLSIPKVNQENAQLESFYWEGMNQLKQNKWNIPEPCQGILTPVEKIDIILVPLLVFDQQGHRIGYGKGFYDRLLTSCRRDCKKVGLSFFPPIELISPTEGHDQRLDHVITPQKNYQFS
jgi:5-formyltetrahydrofolate cyclo-ligase